MGAGMGSSATPMVARVPEASIVPTSTTNVPATAYVQAIGTAPVPTSSTAAPTTAAAPTTTTANPSEIAIVTAVPTAPQAASTSAAPTCSLVDLAAYAASQNPSSLHAGLKAEASPFKG